MWHNIQLPDAANGVEQMHSGKEANDKECVYWSMYEMNLIYLILQLFLNNNLQTIRYSLAVQDPNLQEKAM